MTNMVLTRFLQLPGRMARIVRSWRSDHDQPITALPLYIWNKLQERRLQRNAAALDKKVSLDQLPPVNLTLVETEAQRKELIDLYFSNPSSLVWAPRTDEALDECLASGIEYFLIHNDDNDLVGARAIRVDDAYIVHSTIDRRFRRQGYWLASEISFCRALAERGLTRLITDAFRENTSIIRSAVATGWVEETHPNDERLVRLTKAL